MALSAADRAALQERAEGLRLEVSSLKSDQNSALAEASATGEDAKLLAEVARLESERDAAIAGRDAARGTVEDAMVAMKVAAEKMDAEALPPVNVNPAPLVESELLVKDASDKPESGEVA